jgi:hypothetical protein
MICFVEHGDLDIAEVAVVLPDEIGQPPRQATTISARLRSAVTCGFCGVPPKMAATLSPMASASGARTAWTWVASSRVGTRTRPRGRHAIVYPPASLATSGRENPSPVHHGPFGLMVLVF